MLLIRAKLLLNRCVIGLLMGMWETGDMAATSNMILSIIWNELLEIKTYIKTCQLSDFSFLLHFTGQGWCWPVYNEYSTKQNLGKPKGEQRLFSCFLCMLRDLPSTRANCIMQATLHACWCYFISKGCLAASVNVDLDLSNITGIRFLPTGSCQWMQSVT